MHRSIYSEWGPRELWRAMNPRSRRLEPSIADLRGELAFTGERAALRYAAFSIGLAASGFGGLSSPGASGPRFMLSPTKR